MAIDSVLEAMADGGYNTFTAPKIIKLKSKVLNGLLNGGLPEGSVIQLAAGSGTGKSTIALDISRELCQQKYKVLYIDVEKGLNPSQLTGTGVMPFFNNQKKNQGAFYIAREYDCNRIKHLVDTMCPRNKDNSPKKPLVNCIVLDSIGALDSGIYNDAKSDINNPKVGGDTKTIKILMKYFNGIAIDFGITFILINHTLKSIGLFPTENPVGGSAPQYLSDVVLKLKAVGKPLTNAAGVPVAQQVTAEAIKSRFGPGKLKQPFYVSLGKGISNLYTYKDILENMTVEFEGKKVKALTITSGNSANHLYLHGKDIAFNGKDLKTIATLIKDNYTEIDKMIPDSMFMLDNSEFENVAQTNLATNSDDFDEPDDIDLEDVELNEENSEE